jgi:hypothetical protein
VIGTGAGVAKDAIAVAAPAFTTASEGVANVTGAPVAADTTAILSANSHISTAFGADPHPVYFAIEELGAGHSSGGGGTSQMTTSTADVTVDLTKLASRHDLIVGLYKGAAVGSGISSVAFDLYADGVDVIHKTGLTAAQAVTLFTNDAIDVGSLASGALSGNTLTLHAVLTVVSTGASSGFYGGLLIGDPPAADGVHAAQLTEAGGMMVDAAQLAYAERLATEAAQLHSGWMLA